MQFRYAFVKNNQIKEGPLFYHNLFAELEYRRLNPIISLIVSLEQDNDPNFENLWRNEKLKSILTGHAHVVRVQIHSNETMYQKFQLLYPSAQAPSIYIFGPEKLGPSVIFSCCPSLAEFVSSFAPISSISQTSISPIPILEEPPHEEEPVIPPTPKEEEISTKEIPSTKIQNPPPILPPVNSSSLTPKKSKSAPIQENKVKDNYSKEINSEISYSPKPKPDPIKFISVGIELPSGKTILKGFDELDNVAMVKDWIYHVVPENELKNQMIVIIPSEKELPNDSHITLVNYKPMLHLKIVPKRILPQFHLPHFSLFSEFSFLSSISPIGSKNDNPYEFWGVNNNQVEHQPNPNQNNQHHFTQREGNMHVLNHHYHDDNDNHHHYNNGNNQQFDQ